ncbi:MAG: hypothetical protein ACI93R_003204 [Flavobacteriales bacterium]
MEMLRLIVPARYKVVRSLIFQQLTRVLASFLPHLSGEEPFFASGCPRKMLETGVFIPFGSIAIHIHKV